MSQKSKRSTTGGEGTITTPSASSRFHSIRSCKKKKKKKIFKKVLTTVDVTDGPSIKGTRSVIKHKKVTS